jgi:transposase
MSAPKAVPTQLTPTERRELVNLGIKAGKSNRAIAKELGVNEGTVRRDLKFLATPENERRVKVPRPKKERPVCELPPEKVRERRMQSLLEVAQLWITREGLILPDIEYIVDKAGKLLYKNRPALENIPISLRSPSELIVWARPERTEEDVTGLEHYGK